MKYFSIFILCTLFSCSSENEEHIKLNNDYKELSLKYDSLQTLLSSVSTRIIAIPRSNKIIKGEEFEADIFLVPYSKGENPTSALHFRKPNSLKSDSIVIRSKQEFTSFKFTPEEIGEYQIYGKLKQRFLGKEFDQLFEMNFEVLSK